MRFARPSIRLSVRNLLIGRKPLKGAETEIGVNSYQMKAAVIGYPGITTALRYFTGHNGPDASEISRFISNVK